MSVEGPQALRNIKASVGHVCVVRHREHPPKSPNTEATRSSSPSQRRQRQFARRQPAQPVLALPRVASRGPVVVHAVPHRKPARKEAGAARRADGGRGVGLGEERALGRPATPGIGTAGLVMGTAREKRAGGDGGAHLVEVRRVDRGVAVDGEVVVAKIVRQDVHEVGGARGLGGTRQRDQHERTRCGHRRY